MKRRKQKTRIKVFDNEDPESLEEVVQDFIDRVEATKEGEIISIGYGAGVGGVNFTRRIYSALIAFRAGDNNDQRHEFFF